MVDWSMKMAEQVARGESAEMYLKTICELTSLSPLVPISTLAERLGISVVSATEMVHRMVDQDLVEHERYKGIQLTNEGRLRALDIIRRHRIWECFLMEKLHIPWEETHDVACQLEHAADRQVVDALADFLGHPESCPHGNPIPSPDGGISPLPEIPLDTLEAGEGGTVLRIRPETRTVLSYLSSRGIKPGVSLEVQSINEFDQLWTLLVDGKVEVLGHNTISRIVLKSTEISSKNKETVLASSCV
jgi:DtxR family Mn-dependent transcriptional regulator